MCNPICFRTAFLVPVILLLTTGLGVVHAGTRMNDARTAYDAGQWDKAVALLTLEVNESPGNAAARVMLGQALEALQDFKGAEVIWESVLKTAQSDEHRDAARRALIRIRRTSAEERDRQSLSAEEEAAANENRDAFHIPMPALNWDEIGPVESRQYVNRLPPFHYESKHFDCFATNEKLAKVIGERSEIYLDFMTEKLFGGRAWGFRMPILCYANEEDYISVGGGPPGTGGVTHGSLSGKSQQVTFFHWTKIEEPGGGEQDRIFKYSVESVLPHELTHVVINEFFGGQEIPQWLHEAVAGRMEQTRDHYLEAARLARAVVAGEHFRMRDLFEQEGYPSSRIGLFYEQSAIVVLYLFEAGPEAMYVFFKELAQQHTHDQALAAALGLPVEGAVEEFEKMWVEWMKRRYVKDLKPDVGEAEETTLTKTLESDMVAPPVDELAAIEAIEDWRSIPADSISDQFCGVGESLRDWSAGGGRLRCEPSDPASSGSFLGVRIDEKRPLAVECVLRAGGERPTAGFAMLDPSREEIGIQAFGKLQPDQDHKIIALLGDELAIYVDGICTGRYPAPPQKRLEAAIDFPLAIVAFGPLEVSELKVTHIKTFKVGTDQPTDGSQPPNPPSSSGGGRGRGRRG